jgi:hypothetical protein
MCVHKQGYPRGSSLAPADSEIGEVLMSNEQQRQLNALLRRGQVDPVGDLKDSEWSGQIGCQDLGDRGPSGRAARTGRACR